MFRFVLLGSNWYGMEIESLDAKEIEDIDDFIESYEPVLLCNSIEVAAECLGIEEDDIIMV